MSVVDTTTHPPHRNPLLAGLGATASLATAMLVGAFVAAGILSFSGWPGTPFADRSEALPLATPLAGTPALGAVAGTQPAAVAGAPIVLPPAAADPGGGSGRSGDGDGPAGSGAGTPVTPASPGVTPAAGTVPPGSAPGQVAGDGPLASIVRSTSGAAAAAADGVSDAAGATVGRANASAGAGVRNTGRSTSAAVRGAGNQAADAANGSARAVVGGARSVTAPLPAVPTVLP